MPIGLLNYSFCLTKANFAEPLSLLQRLAGDFEYSHLLDEAAACTDPCRQLLYVAAFSVSGYATTHARTLKPFNPLLGETFEYDRSDDKGWKVSKPVTLYVCRGGRGYMSHGVKCR